MPSVHQNYKLKKLTTCFITSRESEKPMKNNTHTITILSTAFITTVALHAQYTNEESTNGHSASKYLKEASCKIHGAANDLIDYTFEEKNAFSTRMKDKLSEVNMSLDHLNAKIDHAGTATRNEAQPKLDALRTKADQLGKKVDEIKNATASTWDSVKMDSKNSYMELKGKIRRENKWLRDKLIF